MTIYVCCIDIYFASVFTVWSALYVQMLCVCWSIFYCVSCPRFLPVFNCSPDCTDKECLEPCHLHQVSFTAVFECRLVVDLFILLVVMPVIHWQMQGGANPAIALSRQYR